MHKSQYEIQISGCFYYWESNDVLCALLCTKDGHEKTEPRYWQWPTALVIIAIIYTRTRRGFTISFSDPNYTEQISPSDFANHDLFKFIRLKQACQRFVGCIKKTHTFVCHVIFTQAVLHSRPEHDIHMTKWKMLSCSFHWYEKLFNGYATMWSSIKCIRTEQMWWSVTRTNNTSESRTHITHGSSE